MKLSKELLEKAKTATSVEELLEKALHDKALSRLKETFSRHLSTN